MKAKRSDMKPFPPHLTMDEYANFISENLEAADREQIKIQKDIEERITKRFCIPDEQPD